MAWYSTRFDAAGNDFRIRREDLRKRCGILGCDRLVQNLIAAGDGRAGLFVFGWSGLRHDRRRIPLVWAHATGLNADWAASTVQTAVVAETKRRLATLPGFLQIATLPQRGILVNPDLIGLAATAHDALDSG